MQNGTGRTLHSKRHGPEVVCRPIVAAVTTKTLRYRTVNPRLPAPPPPPPPNADIPLPTPVCSGMGGSHGRPNVFVPGFLRVEPGGMKDKEKDKGEGDWFEWEIVLSRRVLCVPSKRPPTDCRCSWGQMGGSSRRPF